MADTALDPLPIPTASAPTPSSSHLDAFDPTGLGPLTILPINSDAQRRSHHIFVPADHRFKAAADGVHHRPSPDFPCCGGDTFRTGPNPDGHRIVVQA